MNQVIELSKPVAATIATGGVWVLKTLADVTPQSGEVTQWLDKYGLPLLMLALAIYAIVALYKTIGEINKARIADKDATLALYQSQMQLWVESQAKMLNAVNEQTNEIRRGHDAMVNLKIAVERGQK